MSALPAELLFPDEYLCECRDHPETHPGSRLYVRVKDGTQPPEHCCPLPWERCFYGATLWIGDTVYTIDNYDVETNSWCGHWPE